jgi:hypothetical protein
MSPQTEARVQAFLEPLHVDVDTIHRLSREFTANFEELAAASEDQFLATPISESLLRPVTSSQRGHGQHLAIDM